MWPKSRDTFSFLLSTLRQQVIAMVGVAFVERVDG
jgi:hypothetical protein